MGTTGVSRPVVMREGMRDGRGRRFGEVAWIVGMGVELGTVSGLEIKLCGHQQ